VAEADYTQSMIDSVHEKGPYIVIAPGFAFAHARPSDAVLRTGMSWLRLAEPVEFGHPKNDPVTLVVALAARDADAHQAAMAELASVIADPERKAALDAAGTPAEVLRLLRDGRDDAPATEPGPARQRRRSSTRNHILTVCGNGVGTSLFLKNTLEKVLDRWGWGPYITVEATDTVSARGKAKEADLIMTSAEIGRALGDLGVPMRIIDDFTSTREIDAALRASYDV
jgi:PTS system ascorbate-specific IIA component